MITEIVSYGGTTFWPDYEVGFVPASEPRLPPAQVQLLERIGAWPVIATLTRKPQRLALVIRIVGADRHALRSALFRLFDPHDETPKVLTAETHDGTDVALEALCEDLRVFGDQQHDTAFVATLAVHGDVRWRSVTPASDTWLITASGQTHTIANGGEDEAYPVITMEPTSGKTGGYSYRRWVPVVWRSANAGPQYPLRAELATDALVGAGKMQADGDDLRILVDGSETYRWLDAMNTAATGIWFSADFVGAPSLTLKTAIAGAGDVAAIEFNEAEEAEKLPESGILLIDDEAFVYTGRNLTDVSVTGVTRAAKGTAAGAHNIDDTVHWIQHDVYVLYGNATATAPVVDDDYKPAFELDLSDNETWVYEVFGDNDNHRAARWNGWGYVALTGTAGRYTATQRTLATPYTAIGVWISAQQTGTFGWYLENPCGIVNAAWADGQKRDTAVSDLGTMPAYVAYWLRSAAAWTTQAQMTAPAAANVWEPWSEAAAVADWDPASQIGIFIHYHPCDVEAGTVTVSLNTDEIPLVTVNAEQGNYELACTLTNQTTGDAITLSFVMDLDSELEIDTDEQTVTWLADNSGQFQALSLSTARRQWLRLVPGNNTLRFDDTGTGDVTLVTTWEERHY